MPAQPGYRRKWRACFRWFRISALLLVLALIFAAVWFNRIGLPDFLKKPLIETLRARGVELAFTRLRLRMVRGLVAENVRLGPAGTSSGPAISLAEVQLRLNYRALLRRRLQVDGLVLRQGRFVWPLAPAGETPRALALDNIQSDLRFQANDTWSLDNFQADFAGAKLALSGDIAHAPEIRNWEIFHGKKPAANAAERGPLQKFLDALDRIHLGGTPQLSLAVTGDARDIHSFDIRLNASAPSAQTPWGDARDIRLAAHLTAPAGTPATFDSSWDWWTNVLPCRLTWAAQLAQLKSGKLNADSVACSGFWQAPELAVTNLSARLGGGWLEAGARLNVTTREFTFTNSSRFDLHATAALLTEKTRERLADFSWPQPPSVQAGGSLILPAWTNHQPDWRKEVQPTVRLNGELAITNGTFKGVAMDSARAHFSYSNLVWQLPDLRLARGKSRLEIAGSEDDATKDYHWNIRGTLDPEIIRPFLTASNAARGLNHFTFTGPPAVDVDVSGRLYDYDRIAASGRVALTNFTIRGQAADNVAAGLFYTNRILEFFRPRLERAGGAQTMTADKITVDFNAQRIYFTNGFSTADPLAVAQAIGPKTGRVLEPYHFLQPPTVRVNGYAPLRDASDADLRFDIVAGAPFQWLKLKSPNITGTVHWQGASLVLTNVAAAFYGGAGKGVANFDFRPAHAGADYGFVATLTDVNLHALAADLSSPTNHLEGTLAGRLVVTHADSRDWRTWDGFGHANLHDGLLWDIPIFGILSPVLNTVSPGLGNSRATDATAQFTITNGVFFSDSMEIRSTMMRLQYAGTVDMRENVNARVTAQLLRDAWVVGPLVSTALWPVSKLFEYHVTGTLKAPRSRPVYVPKILLMPLHPIRSVEEMFPAGAGPGAPTGK